MQRIETTPFERFCAAIKNKSAADCKTIVKEDKFDINQYDKESGETPLHLAIKSGIIENVKLCVEKGADIGLGTLSDPKATPISYLSKPGFCPNSTIALYLSRIRPAQRTVQNPVAKPRIATLSSPSSGSPGGRVVRPAIPLAQPERKIPVSKPAATHVPPKQEDKSSHSAATNTDEEKARIDIGILHGYLEKGDYEEFEATFNKAKKNKAFDINKFYVNGCNLLQKAALLSSITFPMARFIKLLIKNGANVSIINKEGASILNLAIQKQDEHFRETEAVIYLLKALRDKEYQKSILNHVYKKKNILFFAIERLDVELCQLLIKENIDLMQTCEVEVPQFPKRLLQIVKYREQDEEKDDSDEEKLEEKTEHKQEETIPQKPQTPLKHALMRMLTSEFNGTTYIKTPLKEIIWLLLCGNATTEQNQHLKEVYDEKQHLSILGFLVKIFNIETVALSAEIPDRLHKDWYFLQGLGINGHRFDLKGNVILLDYQFKLEASKAEVMRKAILTSWENFIKNPPTKRITDDLMLKLYDGTVPEEKKSDFAAIISESPKRACTPQTASDVISQYNAGQVISIDVVIFVGFINRHAIGYLFYQDLCVLVNCGFTHDLIGPRGITFFKINDLKKLPEFIEKLVNSQRIPLRENDLLENFTNECGLVEIFNEDEAPQTVGNCGFKSRVTMQKANLILLFFKMLQSINADKSLQYSQLMKSTAVASLLTNLWLKDDAEHGLDECKAYMVPEFKPLLQQRKQTLWGYATKGMQEWKSQMEQNADKVKALVHIASETIPETRMPISFFGINRSNKINLNQRAYEYLLSQQNLSQDEIKKVIEVSKSKHQWDKDYEPYLKFIKSIGAIQVLPTIKNLMQYDFQIIFLDYGLAEKFRSTKLQEALSFVYGISAVSAASKS